MTGGPWTEADDKLLCDLAIEGQTVPQIAALAAYDAAEAYEPTIDKVLGDRVAI